jgi:long-chain acyl-CoA synthetase
MDTVRERLAFWLEHAPDDAEVVSFEDVWWRWSDIRRVVRDLDATLVELGLGPGARIGVALNNRPEHVCVLLAVLATGRCLTTLSPLQPADRLAADITRSDLPVVIAAADVLEREAVRDAVCRTGRAVVLGDDGKLHPDPTDVAQPQQARAAGDPDVVIEMLTSGTTGPPKRVRLTERQLDLSMVSGGIRAKVVDGRPVLGSGVGIVATPLVHIGGLWGVVSATYAGRRMVLLERFRLEQWVHAIETHRPRAAGLVPAAMRAVLDADVPKERLSSLQVVTSGTAPCPPELAGEFTDRYGIRVLMTYGATEFAGALAGWTLPLHVQWWEKKKGSTGRAFSGVRLRIVDDDGAELPAGEVGHLEVLTKQAPNGGRDWTRTSDLAYLDEDGFLFIKGRADDAIIRGGFKVHPEVVKKVLEQHPAVFEAAVAGVPDERLGAVPVAAVQLRPGVEAPSSDDLRAHCREQLTPYEVPVEIRVVDELPRTAALKVSRVELLELFGAGNGAHEAGRA